MQGLQHVIESVCGAYLCVCHALSALAQCPRCLLHFKTSSFFIINVCWLAALGLSGSALR